MLIKMTTDIPKGELVSQGFSETIIEKVTQSNNDWFELNLDEDHMDEFNRLVFENRESIKLDLKHSVNGVERAYNYNFEYDDTMKKLFLLNVEKDVSDKYYTIMVRILETTDKTERVFGKCVRKFTIADIRQYIIEIFETISYHKVEQHVSIVVRYIYFFNKYSEDRSTQYWDSASIKFISDTLESSARKPLLTKKNIRDIFDFHESPQSVLPLVLIFEGVIYKNNEEEDELRHLLEKDFEKGSLGIRNGRGDYRSIDIDNDTYSMIRRALRQDSIELNGGRGFVEFKESPYILKKADTNSSPSNVLSYAAVHSGLQKIKDFAEPFIDEEVKINYRQIRSYGKMHYINMELLKGYDIDDAVKTTLKRFGEWPSGDDPKASTNRVQRARRLEKLFKIHYNSGI